MNHFNFDFSVASSADIIIIDSSDDESDAIPNAPLTPKIEVYRIIATTNNRSDTTNHSQSSGLAPVRNESENILTSNTEPSGTSRDAVVSSENTNELNHPNTNDNDSIDTSSTSSAVAKMSY